VAVGSSAPLVKPFLSIARPGERWKVCSMMHHSKIFRSGREAFPGDRTWLGSCVRSGPAADRRWWSLVEQHPHASVYHTVEWLEVLHRTYGYQPVAFTNSPPTSDLNRALLFCDIGSWLTGHRRVSLPFSDYCEPLCNWGTEFESLISHLKANMADQRWKYFEIRPVDGGFDSTAKKLGFETAGQYIIHRLDLKPTVEEIFRQLHKGTDCTNSTFGPVDRRKKTPIIRPIIGRTEWHSACTLNLDCVFQVDRIKAKPICPDD